jgi:hypothetical protein
MGPSGLRNILTFLFGALLVILALSVVRCDATSQWRSSAHDQELQRAQQSP